MAVSRPILLALLGAVVAMAVFYGAMGSRKASDDSSAPTAAKAGKPADPAPKPAGPAKAAPRADAAANGPASESKADPTKAATASKAPAAKAATEPKAAAPAGVPANVARALERKRTVVLFFFQRGSADDNATAKAVDSVRGRRGVAVFAAPISRLADYRGVAGKAGVSRAPSIVIVGRGGDAKLIEGFVDREILGQEVTDAR